MAQHIQKSKEETTDSAEHGIIHHQQEMFYSAPLPPSVEFERYEKVLKGSADRIISLAENQGKHRRFIEKIVVISDSAKTLIGVVSALIIVVAGIIAGVYLIVNNQSPEGLAALLVPIGVVVTAFLYDKSQDRKKEE